MHRELAKAAGTVDTLHDICSRLAFVQMQGLDWQAGSKRRATIGDVTAALHLILMGKYSTTCHLGYVWRSHGKDLSDSGDGRGNNVHMNLASCGRRNIPTTYALIQ